MRNINTEVCGEQNSVIIKTVSNMDGEDVLAENIVIVNHHNDTSDDDEGYESDYGAYHNIELRVVEPEVRVCVINTDYVATFIDEQGEVKELWVCVMCYYEALGAIPFWASGREHITQQRHFPGWLRHCHRCNVCLGVVVQREVCLICQPPPEVFNYDE